MKNISVGIVVASLLFSVSVAFAQDNLSDGDTSDECVSLQTSLLKFGSRDVYTNGDVTVLQDFLISKGMLSGQTTGYYGKLTVAAVKAYQKSVGVSPTGNVGPLTKSVITSETCSSSSVSFISPSIASQAYQNVTPRISVTKVSLPYIYVEFANLPAAGVDVINQSTGQSIWRQELSTYGSSGSLVVTLPSYVVNGSSYYGYYTLQTFGSSNYAKSDSFYIGGKDNNGPIVPSINFFKASTNSATAGEAVVLSWTSSQASKCGILRNTYTWEAMNLATSGTYTVYPTTSTTYTLQCTGTADGSGKDAPSAQQNTYVSVSYTAPQATIDDNSGPSINLTTSTKSVIVMGTATGVSSVDLVFTNSSGAKVYSLAGVSVTNGQYKRLVYETEFSFVPGQYRVGVYSGTTLLASKIIEIAGAAPTCQVTQQTAPIYNSPFVISWSSTNAAYGVGPFGDKISTNGYATYQLSSGEQRNYVFTFYNATGQSVMCTTVFSSVKG